ncbi:MAG TPA: phosphoribosylaminoimidazolesuccinocarboxamide synthase [Ignavibacteriaceae bacterium]|nr:phosphoribosylaminoimidazolesuccinocarboxamide synthase [Ignavibacteriaceae bacterium]
MNDIVLLQTDFPSLKLFKKGKVRDVYDLGDYFLIVSTDRLSAFDVIMSQGIPYKGKVLTKISEFWFNFIGNIVENHLVTTSVNLFPEVCKPYLEQLKDRSMLCKKADLVPIESVVRGYISGSGWVDYINSGSICGIKLPDGLRESEKLSEPLFTPATKAELGLHDENISEEQAKNIVGAETINLIKSKTVKIYETASEYAWQKGIIIADTKMEFGFYNDKIILIDELLTPDSSRFWPLSKYEAGRGQKSYDKQFVRDYLLSINFNKQPPPPELPPEVIEKTSEKYLDVLYKLTGYKFF